MARVIRLRTYFQTAIFAASCTVLGYSIVSTHPVAHRKPIKDKIDFNRDIRPILASKCLVCHGNDKKAIQAGLKLDSFAGATALLESGNRAIVAHHPEKSVLLKRINESREGYRMPPVSSNKILSTEEKALLKQWIEEGAEYKKHWAFVTPVRPALPKVQMTSWPKNGIDYFILEELEKRGLKPSPEADRTTLIRRVTLDLTGLPPSPADVDNFLADKSPKAYEKLVDRLLASPRFGERMAMDWMDYSRYADSNGYQGDWERFQWRWRDWVINAYNNNMPFDKFTVDQLAGDMIPNHTLDQVIATGFNRNHRINTEGGVIAEEWRVENVIDRVETTSAVWLGMTSGCARCHDHKYDPISQKEFYGLFAYFNNVPESGTGVEQPVNHPPYIKAPYPEQIAQYNSLQTDVKSLDSKLTTLLAVNQTRAVDWTPAGPEPLSSLNDGLLARYALSATPAVVSGKVPAPSVNGAVKSDPGRSTGAAVTDMNSFVDLGKTGNFEWNKPFSYALWIQPNEVTGAPISKMDNEKDYRGWDLFLDNRPAVHIISSWPSNAIKVLGKSMLPAGQWSHIAVTYDGSAKAAGVKIYVNGKQDQADVEADALKGPIDNMVSAKIGRRTGGNTYNGKVDDVSLYTRQLDAAEVANLASVHPAKALLKIPAASRTKEQKEILGRLWSIDNDPEYKKLNAERDTKSEAYQKLDASIPTVMVMEEMKKPRDAFVLVRGVYDKHGAKVPPTVPAALPPLPKGAPNNRLGLAKWIVAPENPLTARVNVNRYWERFFGTGIVSTIEDFGTRADFPSHPKLLDWLATEFSQKGWNVKHMMKTIAMSATYRQSSKVSPKLLEIDPVNKWLARGPRFRLTGEVIRDQAMFAGGLIVEKIGGPSVRPYQPDGVWDEVSFYGNLHNYKHDTDSGLRRRSLYTIWRRTAAPPNMLLFDVPSREYCRVRRSRTNTPLQALTLMNDETYIEAARAVAQNALAKAGTSPQARIEFVYRALLCRKPSQAELNILLPGLAKRIERFKIDRPAAEKLVTLGDLKRPMNVDVAELAAYTLLSSTILNLDEAITKE